MQEIPTIAAEYLTRLRHREASPHSELWRLLDQVTDPEIPVVSIWDLGIVQDIRVEAGTTTVVITPTYSGCPAMTEIRQNILKTLNSHVCGDLKVAVRLSPAWTTDWMSPEGREQLRQHGIAPPEGRSDRSPCCPRCGSPDTTLMSEFGSTACKALFRCQSCSEPFDYFKCI
jgi:ring-1,2-phenylacetyl-CoA epoxidase subunit PaaD